MLDRFCGRHLRLADLPIVVFCLVSITAIALNLRAQSNSPSSVPAEPKSGAAESATARAATRRKAFEADLKRLEEGSSQEPRQQSPEQKLFLSPDAVNALQGWDVPFQLLDREGRDVTTKAEWSLDDTTVAKFVGHSRTSPTITILRPGRVTVRARIDYDEASCEVNVLEGKALPPGVEFETLPKIPDLPKPPSHPIVTTPANITNFSTQSK
jgi:hypothetical protein